MRGVLKINLNIHVCAFIALIVQIELTHCFTFRIDGLAGYELHRGDCLAAPPNRPQEVDEVHVPDIHLDGCGQMSEIAVKYSFTASSIS